MHICIYAYSIYANANTLKSISYYLILRRLLVSSDLVLDLL